MGLEPADFRHISAVDGGGDDVAQGVGGIVAAETLLVDIGFEDIGGLVRVVLQIGQRVEEEAAALKQRLAPWR